MTHYYAFNGDADGLFALQQLRLAEPGSALLVSGVKRDISLLERVPAQTGDTCTALDISLDVNRAPLLALLANGVRVRYFDHHYAGPIPEQGRLEAYLDADPELCTSLLVDRYLEGRSRLWAIAGAFGDSLTCQGERLAQAAGLDADEARRLRELGICVNYNAYGEHLMDLRVAPVALAQELLPYADPRDFVRASPTYRVLFDGYREDMAQAARLEPLHRVPGALLFVLPAQPWARRASGTLANDFANANPENAIAILTPRSRGGFVVSVRVPAQCELAADAFCRRYKTGGGRRSAAGINELPEVEIESFTREFQAQFRTGFVAKG